MSNVYPIHVSDGYSGDSDFEFINNSDSEEAEINCYYKLTNEKDYCCGDTNKNKSEIFEALLFDSPKGIVNKGKLRDNRDKLILSLSQDQILRVEQHQPKFERSENDIVKKSKSSSFTIPFTIVPIDISKNNENCHKSEKSNLPEIVLTSFENPIMKLAEKHHQKQHQQQKQLQQQIQQTTMGLPSEIASSTSSSPSVARVLDSHQIQVHRNENSPSPELLLDRTLSNESMHSLSNKIEYAFDTNSTDAMKPLNLDRSLKHQQAIDLHNSSLVNNAISGRGLDQLMLHENKEPIPNDLKCRICGEIYKDPRTLNCLHSFCFQCLINENFIKDISIPFWSRPDHSNLDWTSISDDISGGKSANSSAIGSSDYSPATSAVPRPESQSSATSFISKKSSDKQSKDKSSKSSPKKLSLVQQNTEKIAIIVCTVCQFYTEIPVGGIRQLPQNFILMRKTENLLIKIGNNVISNIWCSLCCAEIAATYHCVTCTMNLCSFCRQAHERQKSTSNHNIKHILELRKARISPKTSPEETRQGTRIRCSLHPGFDLKSFCISCQQIICSDCMILLHKGHKCEPSHKAFKFYQKAVQDTIDKTKPLCEYATHSISKLGSISVKINKKCDRVQNDVETFMAAYFEAVETHRRILLQQIAKARETKIQIILEQQLDMERKTSQAKDAISFSEELLESGSEIEILSFVNILLKRFEYCQKFKPLLDPKISNTLHFLPEVRAPAINAQNNIPLFGIITTQTVEPHFCTLETEGYTQLRVHRKVELVMLSRDADGVPLCHGGLTLHIQLKYKDSSKQIENQVSDRRDGTYVISFTPDSPGTMTLAITIDNKHIKGSPFTLMARTVKPHRGIFHCCAFCSSKGSKTVSCACEGTMPGFKGCGHGHNGHPGRRHWSCCGSILENSECSAENKF